MVGGFTGPSYDVNIDVLNGFANYRYMEYGFNQTAEKKISLSKDSLMQFAKGLYKNNVFNWKSMYNSECPMCDGTIWGVSIITKENNHFFNENNDYSLQWSKFCESIKALLGEEFL